MSFPLSPDSESLYQLTSKDWIEYYEESHVDVDADRVFANKPALLRSRSTSLSLDIDLEYEDDKPCIPESSFFNDCVDGSGVSMKKNCLKPDYYNCRPRPMSRKFETERASSYSSNTYSLNAANSLEIPDDSHYREKFTSFDGHAFHHGDIDIMINHRVESDGEPLCDTPLDSLLSKSYKGYCSPLRARLKTRTRTVPPSIAPKPRVTSWMQEYFESIKGYQMKPAPETHPFSSSFNPRPPSNGVPSYSAENEIARPIRTSVSKSANYSGFVNTSIYSRTTEKEIFEENVVNTFSVHMSRSFQDKREVFTSRDDIGHWDLTHFHDIQESTQHGPSTSSQRILPGPESRTTRSAYISHAEKMNLKEEYSKGIGRHHKMHRELGQDETTHLSVLSLLKQCSSRVNCNKVNDPGADRLNYINSTDFMTSAVDVADNYREGVISNACDFTKAQKTYSLNSQTAKEDTGKISQQCISTDNPLDKGCNDDKSEKQSDLTKTSLLSSVTKPGIPAGKSSNGNPKKSPLKRRKRKRRNRDPPVKWYVQVRRMDVLLGRGGRSNHHPGNISFRKQAGELREWYRTSDKHVKTDLSQLLVNWVQNEQNGRFLQLDREEDRWFIVTNLVARRKASQALREHMTMEERMARKNQHENLKDDLSL